MSQQEETTLVVDVKMVSDFVKRVATAKSLRTVRDSMTVTELRVLAEAALVGIGRAVGIAKPNGITDTGRINAVLEAEAAHTSLLLKEARERIAELEEKLAATGGGR